MTHKERQILVRRILLDVRVCGAKQGDEDIDEDDSRQETPAIVDDQAERIAKPLRRCIKVGRATIISVTGQRNARVLMGRTRGEPG